MVEVTNESPSYVFHHYLRLYFSWDCRTLRGMVATRQIVATTHKLKGYSLQSRSGGHVVVRGIPWSTGGSSSNKYSLWKVLPPTLRNEFRCLLLRNSSGIIGYVVKTDL